MTNQERGEEFAQQISSFVNGSSRSAYEYAAKKMVRDHRTLQQNMMGLFMQFVEQMAQNGTDMRNEASVELAKAIMALPEKVRILPYI